MATTRRKSSTSGFSSKEKEAEVDAETKVEEVKEAEAKVEEVEEEEYKPLPPIEIPVDWLEAQEKKQNPEPPKPAPQAKAAPTVKPATLNPPPKRHPRNVPKFSKYR